MTASADAAAVAAIKAEMVTLGIPTSMQDALLQAVENAGYDVVPSGGGSAVAIGMSCACAIAAVDGLPALKVVSVTMPDGITVVNRLMTDQELRGVVGQGVADV